MIVSVLYLVVVDCLFNTVNVSTKQLFKVGGGSVTSFLCSFLVLDIGLYLLWWEHRILFLICPVMDDSSILAGNW